jgi:solute carrier family 25 phosphate transporter 23/24/25/41
LSSLTEQLALTAFRPLVADSRTRSVRSIFLPTDTNGTSDAELAVRKLVCGGLAGAVSLLFTHPFDVVRRKLQVAGLSAVSPQYNGAVDCITKICKAEGFWKGM